MNDIEILYDAANNVIVIRETWSDHKVLGQVSADLAMQKRIPDEKAAKFGAARFISFADWQGAVAGRRLTTKTVEELMNDPAHRL